MNSPTLPYLLSLEQVAAVLGVSKRTIYNLSIRYSKIGNQRRYHPSDIELYIQLHQA